VENQYPELRTSVESRNNQLAYRFGVPPKGFTSEHYSRSPAGSRCPGRCGCKASCPINLDQYKGRSPSHEHSFAKCKADVQEPLRICPFF